MLEKIKQLDIDLLIYLNNLGSDNWDSFWMFMTTTITSAPIYAIALFFIFKFYGKKKTLLVLLFVAVLITVSDQMANLFKYGFERLRPCHNEDIKSLIRLVKPYCGGQFSFFSAHASTGMAIAVFCGLLLKRHLKYFPIILFVWALLVGYSRIYIGVHFPVDVLFGFFMGSLISSILYLLFKKLSVRFD